MSTNQTTQDKTGAEIHPELPMPHWATERYLSRSDAVIMDEASYTHGAIEVEILRSIAIDSGRNYGENVSLWWYNNWPTEKPEPETLTVLPGGIPALIEALQSAQRMIASAPRQLRRRAEATAELMGRDA